MKTPMLAGVLIALVVLPAPCTRSAEPAAPATAKVNAVFVDPDAPEAADFRKAGEAAINRLAFTLINELNSAIAKGGLEAAVDVAHLKNLPMTGDRVTGLPRIKAIKRTSFRLRSAANAPDAADQLALDRVIKELASDYGAPKILIQRIDQLNASPEWRVYTPLGSMSMCLKCHGDAELQPVGLRDKLNLQYPSDQATGYRIGEWRGLMRVTVDSAPPPPPPSQPKTPAPAAPKKK